MLGVCVGGGAEPVEPVVVEGLVPGFEVEVLPAWVDVELEADVLPPSAALQRWFFWGEKTNLVMLWTPCALKRNMNPNAQKRLNCKSNESFLKTDTKHLVESACLLTYLCAVFMTKCTVRPSLMPCWLRLSPSFKIFPAKIRTSWSCLALNRLEISSLN